MEFDRGVNRSRHDAPDIRMNQGNPSYDVVSPSNKLFQHSTSFVKVPRLPKHFCSKRNKGIRAEYDRIRALDRHRNGLLERIEKRQLIWSEKVAPKLFHLGG